MFRRIHIKTILILFIVLLGVYALTWVLQSGKGDRSFRNDLIDVDPGEISKIEIYPRVMSGQVITLLKEGDAWMVEAGGKFYNADASLPGSMIAELNEIKPLHLAASKKASWSQFEVNDSLGTRVVLSTPEKTVADIMIGKFNYQAQKMTTYVRLTSDNEVFGVDGFLSMMFNRDLKSFRDQTIVKGGSADWTKLTFSYPADSSFVLTKIEDYWMMGNTRVDSAAVAEYFSEIANLRSGIFSEETISGNFTHSLLIEGNNMMVPIKIEGRYLDEKNFLFNSSLNNGTVFNDINQARKIYLSPQRLL